MHYIIFTNKTKQKHLHFKINIEPRWQNMNVKC